MLTGEETAAERQLAGGKRQRLTRHVLGAAAQLDDHVARTDDRNPALRCALSLTHTGLQRLLAVGLVREHADPNLTLALHVTRRRDTRGLNLRGSQPATVKDLQAVLTKVQLVTAARDPGVRPALNLSVIYAFWHQWHF